MEDSLVEVESLLGYQFRDRRHLQAALTHSSYTDAVSYERLEFIGDAALGLLLTEHLYMSYPDLHPGDLTLLRAANISTEKLARVAVRHNLYHYLRRNAPALDDRVRSFTIAVKKERDEAAQGSSLKAPKVLADVVEAIAAAVYVDCGFDLKALWGVFRGLLEPIVTRESLQGQPITTLNEFCQKWGKKLDIRHSWAGSMAVSSVYVDGKLISSALSEQKETSKIIAAKEALDILLHAVKIEVRPPEGGVLNGVEVKDCAKQKLYEFCIKKGWPKPCYRLDAKEGPSHDRRFHCSVKIGGATCIYVAQGDPKQRLNEAESSAALKMFRGLSLG